MSPECGEPLLAEARKIVSHNSESLYLHSGDHANFITYLLNAGMQDDDFISVFQFCTYIHILMEPCIYMTVTKFILCIYRSFPASADQPQR